MADDFEKAIQTAYGPTSSQQARTSALLYLNQLSESATGWRTFVEKLFGTGDIHTALVCLSLLGDVVLHRYAAFFAQFYLALAGRRVKRFRLESLTWTSKF